MIKKNECLRQQEGGFQGRAKAKVMLAAAEVGMQNSDKPGGGFLRFFFLRNKK